MKAKFETTESIKEAYAYTRPQAVGAIFLGLFLAGFALALGITLMVVKSLTGGILLMISMLFLASIILYFGFIGAEKMMKSNTLLMTNTTKIIELSDDRVEEYTEAEEASEKRVIGYKHVTSISYNGKMFTIYISDGTSVLCSADKIVEGNIDEIREFYRCSFGKLYRDSVPRAKDLAEIETDTAVEPDVQEENSETERNESNDDIDTVTGNSNDADTQSADKQDIEKKENTNG